MVWLKVKYTSNEEIHSGFESQDKYHKWPHKNARLKPEKIWDFQLLNGEIVLSNQLCVPFK